MEKDGQTTEPERTKDEDAPVEPYDLLYLIRAYNRKEITREEWMRLSKEWAEWILRKHGEGR